MLQFEEKAVRKVQRSNLEQELKIKKPEEILLIYHNDRYIGYLGWEKETWNRPENIVSEYIESEADIIEICEKMLAIKPVIKIPVLIKKSVSNKINFVRKSSSLTGCEMLLTAIESLKRTKSANFSRQLSKYEGVLLLGSGLIVNQLEKLFIKYDLNVLRTKSELVNANWLVLGESENEYRVITQSIIREAENENLFTYFKIKYELVQKGIPVLLIAFPSNSDLQLTKEEKYRVEREITFAYARKILKQGSLVEQKELTEVYQRKISEEDIDKAAFMELSKGEENTLYLCGPCIVSGNAPEGDRFPEILYQEIMSKFGYKIERVIISEVDSITANQLFRKEFKRNDFLIIVRNISKDLRERFKPYIDIDLTDFFKNRSKKEAWFSDYAMHITGEGSRQLIKYLYPILGPYLHRKESDSYSDKKYKQVRKLELSQAESKELELYFRKIEPLCFEKKFSEESKIGAIVMNCNPFTNGHKYLVEQAIKQVDGLYIFVVEENLSIFPYADRMALVKAGIGNSLNNVRVIPSGRFVLSSRTFASYFAKENLQTKIVDASEDVTFFGQFIAPRLHIAIRFFGEEPIDAVTRQYNEDMKSKLPYYGVKVKEIPRIGLEGLTKRGSEISASKARDAWKENDWNLLKKLVPTSTLQYLRSQNKEVFFKNRKKMKYEKDVPEKRREQLEQIRRLIKRNGMVILYGVGLDAKGIVGFMEKDECNKILFCDKRATEREFCFEGIPVIAPKELFRKYFDKGIYITATQGTVEIFEELMDGGIAYPNIFFNPYPWFEI